MDFITKHYEKLILAFGLLLLLVGIAGVALSASRTTALLAENYSKAKRDVEGGNLVDEMSTSAYNVERYFNDPRKVCSILGNAKEQTDKGSMLEPNKMIICVNEECEHILLLTMDVCPFCNTKQPELSKSAGVDEDTDGDGVPDVLEQKYDFMNYRDPLDAMLDQDNDGFLNYEEIMLNTDPDNAEDFPPLAYLLRVARVVYTPIPVEMVEIEKNRSEEVAKWDIVLKFRKNNNEPQPKRHTVQLNDVIMGKYKVTQAGFAGEGDMAEPYVVIVAEGVEDEEYRLVPNKKVNNVKPTVQFLYLATRRRSEFNRMRRRLVKNVMQGGSFQYSINKGYEESYNNNSYNNNSYNNSYTEYYKLLEVDAEAKTCKVALLDGKDGAVLKTIDVPAFDEKSEKDFMKEDRNNGDMMMEDGMMMPPGVGGPRGGMRPPRR